MGTAFQTEKTAHAKASGHVWQEPGAPQKPPSEKTGGRCIAMSLAWHGGRGLSRHLPAGDGENPH